MTAGVRRTSRGFSLLEVLVAFSIMAISLTLIYRVAGGAVRSTAALERYQEAAVVAQSLLAAHDAVPAGGWAGEGTSAGFHWRVQSAPFPTAVSGPSIPALYDIQIFVDWQEGEASRQLALRTLRPEARVLPSPGTL